MTEVRVSDNAASQRYEAHVDGRLAGQLFYQERDGALVLIHTEVAGEFEGQGIGSRLVAGTLESIRERGLGITPLCPFVVSYLERHPEYGDLVVE